MFHGKFVIGVIYLQARARTYILMFKSIVSVS
ncbi:hypothetical protein Desfe_0157 [Desulfurococcus amylolyticus DSM 16532]|uniref:Uncharacterized protein n=1 Tax=Desulfurococcus amylolyticus DSM 16532 TaxID=768672 RepID=I3XQ44_DESAM|nr:hypothetical protein Desfe_0157 [Desulfurococcus amylolyticus DSM 16532]